MKNWFLLPVLKSTLLDQVPRILLERLQFDDDVILHRAGKAASAIKRLSATKYFRHKFTLNKAWSGHLWAPFPCLGYSPFSRAQPAQSQNSPWEKISDGNFKYMKIIPEWWDWRLFLLTFPVFLNNVFSHVQIVGIPKNLIYCGNIFFDFLLYLLNPANLSLYADTRRSKGCRTWNKEGW